MVPFVSCFKKQASGDREKAVYLLIALKKNTAVILPNPTIVYNEDFYASSNHRERIPNHNFHATMAHLK